MSRSIDLISEKETESAVGAGVLTMFRMSVNIDLISESKFGGFAEAVLAATISCMPDSIFVVLSSMCAGAGVAMVLRIAKIIDLIEAMSSFTLPIKFG